MKEEKRFFIWKETAQGEQDGFFSPIYDSREKGTRWHRIMARQEKGKKAVTVSCYIGDQLKETAEQLIDQTELSLTEKKKQLRPFLQKEGTLPGDWLLHQLEGRYLLLLAEVTGEAAEKSWQVRIEFPKSSWVQYLPGVYEEKGPDSFLERFLCIFQSLYEDVDAAIREYPFHLCPEVCDSADLPVLAGWLDVKNAYFWKEEQLRILLSHLMEFYENRGTPASIRWLVNLYTGEQPLLVEYYDVEAEREEKNGTSRQRARLIRQLYGENPFRYTLLVGKEYKALPAIIAWATPAHMEGRIVVLRPDIRLNGYSYLGINSRLQRGEELF